MFVAKLTPSNRYRGIRALIDEIVRDYLTKPQNFDDSVHNIFNDLVVISKQSPSWKTASHDCLYGAAIHLAKGTYTLDGPKLYLRPLAVTEFKHTAKYKVRGLGVLVPTDRVYDDRADHCKADWTGAYIDVINCEMRID